MAFFLFFVDGIGIGSSNPDVNPCADNGLAYLNQTELKEPQSIQKEGYAFPVDTHLEVSGLPQSATGQTTLLSGINAARRLNRHLPGFPNETLRSLLREHSILKQLTQRGIRSRFLNTFRPKFFELKPETRWHFSATTVASLSADIPFFRLKDLRQYRALYHDLSNEQLVEKGFDVPRFSEKEAASVAVDALNEYDFILYEFFLTDRAGHKQNHARAKTILKQVDDFLTHLVNQIDLTRHTVLFTSDHGNIEDLSVKSHTRNPAMTLCWGKAAETFAGTVTSLEHITPAILNYFSED